MALLAPAKVNAHLRIVGRRSDGYHLLESVMVPIELFDRVVASNSSDGEIRLRCSDPALEGQQNLAWRAATALREATHCPKGAEIRLLKRIPAGAGLGGGSSDAAAVLLLLNRLWRLELSPHRLARIGLTLGADVPFFLAGRAAVVRGIGERVRPIGSFPTCNLVLAWPGFPISTRRVYQALNWRAVRDRPASPIPPFLRGRKPFASLLQNDLEAAATKAHPQVSALRREIERVGAEKACMSGSGSAVFGVFASRRAARGAALELRRQGFWSIAVRTLAVSPSPIALKVPRIRRIR